MSAPLPTLLSQVLVARTRALEAEVPDDVPLPMWSNLLRVVEDGGTQLELTTRARVSKRAMKTMVKFGARQGWLALDGKLVHLTDAGRAADAAWRAVVTAADDALRVPLAAIVGALPLEHPHYPVGYGTADPRITGGIPHGQDWRPVERAGGDTVSGLPLVALLSQALVGFTVEYEQRGLGALPQAATVLRLVSDDGLALAALDPAAGVAGNGKSNLERHGFLTVNRDRVVFLTADGWRVRERYADVLAEIERSWVTRFGADVVGALRAALGAPDPSLPHHPLVTWSSADGFRERSAR